MINLDRREIALATSGLASLGDTARTGAGLEPLLSAGYPEPDDHEAWQLLRAGGALSNARLDDPRLSTRVIAGVPCRVIDPPVGQLATGGYLHIHGGGWSFGSHESQDERLLALSDATGLQVVSVGYRLVPEYDLRAAMSDCEVVAREVTAQSGFWAIGGESAGAHLSVTTLIRLRDTARIPFRAAVLTFGCFDLAGTPSRRRGPGTFGTLNRALLPDADDALLRAPEISPLYADLAQLPPARFLCGTRDGLLDDTLMMEARWRREAATELDLVAGAVHAFTLIAGPTTAAARGGGGSTLSCAGISLWLRGVGWSHDQAEPVVRGC
ncbi:acetyl esterase/lipase [Nakamurella sp. UYEF19]|uniref:alpha/beta hydrolase n=1 Tax=Nakamurella sp. UYEF19 TaxID=1756392 RepID=UPI00339594CC